MALNKTYTTENLNTAVGPSSPKPSPIAIIAAATEGFRVVFGEIRGLVGDIIKGQIDMLSLIPEEKRFDAFQAILNANVEMIKSDERVQLALLGTLEKMGASAAAVLPSVFELRKTELELRLKLLEAEAESRSDARHAAADLKIVAEMAERRAADERLEAEFNAKYVK